MITCFGILLNIDSIFLTTKTLDMNQEKIKWTQEQYNERVQQMRLIGMTTEQINLILDCVVITDDL